MLADTLNFFIQTLGGLFAVAVLLRFAMQAMRVAFANPFAQFIVRITDFAVRPLRRVIPGWGGYDWASLLLAWLTEVGWRQHFCGSRIFPSAWRASACGRCCWGWAPWNW